MKARRLALIWMLLCLVAWPGISCKREQGADGAQGNKPELSVRSNQTNTLIDLRNMSEDEFKHWLAKASAPLPIEERLSNLVQEVSGLKIANSALRSEIESRPKDWVKLDVYSKKFRFLRFQEFGNLIILCVGAEPYLNGHKLKLQVGNPFVASFDATIECEYGLKEPDSEGFELEKFDALTELLGGTKVDEPETDTGREFLNSYRAHLRSIRKASATATLTSGFWNDVELILAPSAAAELEYLKVTLSGDNISLRSLPSR